MFTETSMARTTTMRIPLRRSRTPADRRTADSRPVSSVCEAEINPNFSRDQLDRVDRGRTNRDTIA